VNKNWEIQSKTTGNLAKGNPPRNVTCEGGVRITSPSSAEGYRNPLAGDRVT